MVLQESPTAKRTRFKNEMQMIIPLKAQTTSACSERNKGNLGKVFVSRVLGTPAVLENHPPFQFLCLNLVVTH